MDVKKICPKFLLKTKKSLHFEFVFDFAIFCFVSVLLFINFYCLAQLFNVYFIYLFYLYIYPPDLQESDRAANT